MLNRVKSRICWVFAGLTCPLLPYSSRSVTNVLIVFKEVV